MTKRQVSCKLRFPTTAPGSATELLAVCGTMGILIVSSKKSTVQGEETEGDFFLLKKN